MSIAVDEYAIECVLERELVACVRVWDGCSCPCDRVQVDLQRQGAIGGQSQLSGLNWGTGLAIRQSKSLCVSWLAMPYLRVCCRSERATASRPNLHLVPLPT